MKKKLPRDKQCAKCPWKAAADPLKIPGGYSVEKHEALKETVAEPGKLGAQCLRAMACHESAPDEGMYCVGWLANQLGPGNNIPLRLKMMNYDLSGFRTFGKQHERFEDTLPKRKTP